MRFGNCYAVQNVGLIDATKIGTCAGCTVHWDDECIWLVHNLDRYDTHTSKFLYSWHEINVLYTKSLREKCMHKELNDSQENKNMFPEGM